MVVDDDDADHGAVLRCVSRRIPDRHGQQQCGAALAQRDLEPAADRAGPFGQPAQAERRAAFRDRLAPMPWPSS
jgi:hypothetical protein